ncbi:MAG: dihydrolipoyl dehydrogenase [Candidatus Krumholzibacteriota bacterium]|nr:dihydrolipoyl dehydrogenase [Candidatus Krumholzibacteriota bacterium]
MAERYDLVILGAGPGGYVAAVRAGQLGLRTAVVEKRESPGGTCLHWGCVPTKVLLHAAGLLEDARGAAAFGVQLGAPALDLGTLHKRKAVTIRRLAKAIENLLDATGVERVRGRGRLDGPGRVLVEGDGGARALAAERVLLATGSETSWPRGFEPDGKRILSSDHALTLPAIPAEVVIVGAGAIGLEFASILHAFGARVTLVELLDRIAPTEDAELSEALRAILVKKGIRVHTGARLAPPGSSGDDRLALRLEAGGEETALAADALLVATGRRPVTGGIGLETVGLKPDAGGFLPVGPRQETAAEGIWAIGDIVPGPQLAHLASAEGLVAVAHMTGGDPRPIDRDLCPACIYCHPELASVGLTEQTARERGLAVETAVFPLAANSKATLINAGQGMVKLVAEAGDGRLLGAHALGRGATELIAEGGLAVQAGLSAAAVGRAIHGHPTLSEVWMEAAHALAGRSIHLPPGGEG